MKSKNASVTKVSASFILFSFICFGTAFFLSDNNSFELEHKAKFQDELLGPFEVKEDASVFKFIFTQKLPFGPVNKPSVQDPYTVIASTWSYVTLELLDENKKYLFSTGRNFWAEKYYHGGSSYAYRGEEAKFTIKEKGKYFLRVKSENSALAKIQENKKKQTKNLKYIDEGFKLISGDRKSYTINSSPKDQELLKTFVEDLVRQARKRTLSLYNGDFTAIITAFRLDPKRINGLYQTAIEETVEIYALEKMIDGKKLLAPVSVKMFGVKGSSIPHLIGGIFALLIGVFLYLFKGFFKQR